MLVYMKFEMFYIFGKPIPHIFYHIIIHLPLWWWDKIADMFVPLADGKPWLEAHVQAAVALTPNCQG